MKTEPSGGLLANGSANGWFIDVDESPNGDDWSMQIDGPVFYLRFTIADLQVIPQCLAYLRSGPWEIPSNGKLARAAGVALGRLGSMAVTIIRDDEVPTRWFLIIGGKGNGVVRFTLTSTDIHAMAEALFQTLDDLPELSDASKSTAEKPN